MPIALYNKCADKNQGKKKQTNRRVKFDTKSHFLKNITGVKVKILGFVLLLSEKHHPYPK